MWYERIAYDTYILLLDGLRTASSSEMCMLQGHIELGSIALLFRQLVCGLRTLKGSEAIGSGSKHDINTCGTLTALKSGLIKSSIHRVLTPPQDEAENDRLEVLYFSRPNNHVLLDPIDISPLLKRLEKNSNAFMELGKHLTMDEWVKARQQQQQSESMGARVTAEGKCVDDTEGFQIQPGLPA